MDAELPAQMIRMAKYRTRAVSDDDEDEKSNLPVGLRIGGTELLWGWLYIAALFNRRLIPLVPRPVLFAPLCLV